MQSPVPSPPKPQLHKESVPYICPKGGLLAIAFPSRRKVVSSTTTSQNDQGIKQAGKRNEEQQQPRFLDLENNRVVFE